MPRMLVGDIARRLKSFAPTAAVRAMVPLGDGSGNQRELKIIRAGHHTPPNEITESVPVQIFAESWDGVKASTDGTIATVMADLANHLDGALASVAVPTSQGHHRCLEIMSIGLGPSNEEVSGNLVVELVCEQWLNSQAMIIRDDDPLPTSAG